MSTKFVEERLKLLRVTNANLLAQYHATTGAIQELELLIKTMVDNEQQENVDTGCGVQDGPDSVSAAA